MSRNVILLIIITAVFGENENNMNSSVTNVPQTTWTTENIYTSNNNNELCITDISPSPDDSCLDFYRWSLCGEDWMKGACCLTCGYTSCLDICYNNDINNVPSEYYPNPFDCTSNIPPPPDGPDGSQSSCIDQASWDNCGQWWMYGFCCSSCPNDCGCDANNNSIIARDTNNTEPVVTVFYNYTDSPNNCNRDIPPPPGPDGKIFECIDQYRWRNCEESWMNSYCCLTCGYVSCLDTCWNGEVDNIPSKYYPTPFDCESNDFLQSDGDSCIDEASWNHCGQSWMFGLCCVSCPEACNCMNYSWGNNTAYINSRPAVIVTLTFEEIRNWERVFITLHTLLLFTILVIPLMLCYKLWFQHMTTTILQRITSITEPDETTEHRDDPESITSTNRHKTAVASLNSIRSISTNRHKRTSPDPISSDDELSAGTRGETFGSRSGSPFGSRSRSRKSTGNGASTTAGNKVYAFYKILAIICIFLWALTIICQLISLILWYHDEYTDNLIESISKEWDTFRMLVYIIGKMLMYTSFICRVYFSFRTSAYGYSIYFILFLFVILLTDTIVKILCYITQINDLSGNMINRDYIKYNNNDSLLFYGLIFLIIEEVIYTIILIFAFLRPLFVMSINAKHLSKDVLNVITKYVILGIWCVVSSAIISIIRLFYLSTTNIFIIWLTALFESLDCAINTWCTILLFTIADSWYKKCCKHCIKCIRSVCVKEFKSDGIELDEL